MTDLSPGRINERGEFREIREDHSNRYRWAGRLLSGRVIDAGCNCGYGAAMLADAGLQVTAVDCRVDALDFAREHYHRQRIVWDWQDFERDGMWLVPADAVVAFEIIEHLDAPERLLRAAAESAPVLLASVPNEAVWPWKPRLAPVHKRHYTKPEFKALLRDCGWKVTRWWGQEGAFSDVKPDVSGRTLVAECQS